jgi:hypothetical protein
MEVTRRQVLAFRLAAHHLDARLPPDDWLSAVAVIGLRTSAPGTAETSLHARVEGVSADLLASAVRDRVVVEVESAHGARLVPFDDVPVFTVGALADGDESLRGRLRRAVPEGWTPTSALDAVHAAALDALADGPLTTAELSQAITRRIPEELSPYCRGCGCAHVEPALYRLAGVRGAWAPVPSDDGRSRLGRLDAWLGRPPPEMDRRVAQDALVRRFLRAHGPATPRELAEWSALSVADATARLERWGDALVPVRYAGRDAVVHTDDLSALRDAAPVSSTRLVPPYDPLLATPDRATLAPDPATLAELWRRVANSGAVVADGDVVAAWRGRKSGRRLVATVTPFPAWRARHRRAVEAELSAIAALRGCADAQVEVTA